MWLILRDMQRGGVCVCARVFIWHRGGDRSRKQREAWRERYLRHGGGTGRRQSLSPGLVPANDAPPAPHFLTLPINRSSIWSASPDPSKGPQTWVKTLRALLVLSSDLTSISIHLCSCTFTFIKSKKNICESNKDNLNISNKDYILKIFFEEGCNKN